MRNVIRTLAPVILISISMPVSATPTKPFGLFYESLQDGLGVRCKLERSVAEAVIDREDYLAQSVRFRVEMYCDCLPEELEARASQYGGPTSKSPIEERQAVDLVRSAEQACAARNFRRLIRDDCANHPEAGVADMAGYCACLSNGVDGLDDKTIIEASVAQYNDFQARVDAKAKDAPEPAPTATIITSITNTCRASHSMPTEAQ